MVDICFHYFLIISVIWRMFLNFLDENVIEIFRIILSGKGSFFQVWSSSSDWWMTTRDGPMILSDIFAVIALKHFLI